MKGNEESPDIQFLKGLENSTISKPIERGKKKTEKKGYMVTICFCLPGIFMVHASYFCLSINCINMTHSGKHQIIDVVS